MSLRDWSSDVCSSDLSARTTISPTAVASFAGTAVVGGDVTISSQVGTNGTASTNNGSGGFVSVANVDSGLGEIGRASCRERGQRPGSGGSWCIGAGAA